MATRSADARRILAGWGMTAPTAADVVPLDPGGQALTGHPHRGVLARGLGRSYGDAAQNAGGTVLDATANDGTITIDADAGTATVSSGVSIDALLRRIVPLGFFVPVTPGTRFVTIGGAIASDIHGKNHHLDGSIAGHVRSLTLATPVGVRVLTAEDDLFWATTGGMGLTGAILAATIDLPRIRSAKVRVDTDRSADLDGVLALMEDDYRYRYSVAWIDTTARGRHVGRSILTRGDFADDNEFAYDARIRLTAPPVFPAGLVNPVTIKAFNAAWYRKAPHSRKGELQTIPHFFHPLDMVGHWNRVYGHRGVIQYQFVVPFGAESTLARTLERLGAARIGSWLAVLKRFGPANRAPLSFPAPGWTLAIDVPVSAGLGAVLDAIDEEVVGAGGRIYLAKDARVRPELVEAMYPRLPAWRAVQRLADPGGILESDLDRRLNLTGRHG